MIVDDQEDVPEFPAGHTVLALYPSTTCFYKAIVVQPPSKVKKIDFLSCSNLMPWLPVDDLFSPNLTLLPVRWCVNICVCMAEQGLCNTPLQDQI
jgi:hypothetical protein